MKNLNFIHDIKTLRQSAKEKIEQGAITSHYTADISIVIDSYRQMIKYVSNDDPTTHRLFEEILSVEEEHANDLLELKKGIR